MNKYVCEKNFWYIMLVALLLRVIMMLLIHPFFTHDSPEYWEMGYYFKQLDFTGYSGVRLPGYPIFILLCGHSIYAVWIVQMLLGLTSVGLLYLISRKSGVAGWQLWFALVPVVLGMQFIAAESAVISESLAICVLIWLVREVQKIFLKERTDCIQFCYVSLLTGWLIWIRPQFTVCIPILLMGFLVWYISGKKKGIRIKRAIFLYLLISSVFLGGWICVNKQLIDYAGLSTNMPTGILNHCGPYMEHIDDQYALFRDIYIQQRELLHEEVQAYDGSLTIVQKAAIQEYLEITNISKRQLSSQIMPMAWDLFKRYPHFYLKNILSGFISAWRVPLILDPEALRYPSSMIAIMWCWMVCKTLWVIINGVYLISCTVLIIKFGFRRVVFEKLFVLILSCLLIGSALFQSMLEAHSEASRYGLPMLVFVPLSLILIWRKEYDKNEA